MLEKSGKLLLTWSQIVGWHMKDVHIGYLYITFKVSRRELLLLLRYWRRLLLQQGYGTRDSSIPRGTCHIPGYTSKTSPGLPENMIQPVLHEIQDLQPTHILDRSRQMILTAKSRPLNPHLTHILLICRNSLLFLLG